MTVWQSMNNLATSTRKVRNKWFWLSHNITVLYNESPFPDIGKPDQDAQCWVPWGCFTDLLDVNPLAWRKKSQGLRKWTNLKDSSRGKKKGNPEAHRSIPNSGKSTIKHYFAVYMHEIPKTPKIPGHQSKIIVLVCQSRCRYDISIEITSFAFSSLHNGKYTRAVKGFSRMCQWSWMSWGSCGRRSWRECSSRPWCR